MNALKHLGASSLAWCLFSAAALAQTFETIDPPNTVGTQPLGVHQGTVVGMYYDGITGRSTGFSFSRSNGYQTFDAPNVDSSVGTYAVGSDDAGRISGWFVDASDFHVKSFVRARNGAMSVYEVPVQYIYDTYVFDMNSHGFVTGQYLPSSDNNSHGYVRNPGGVIQNIMIPGNEYVIPWAINDDGLVAGYFAEQFYTEFKGFLRTIGGQYTTFTAPPECGFGEGHPLEMNSQADLIGTCANRASSFLRKHGGGFVIIDYPGAVETVAHGIAANGDISGYYTNADFGVHGFIRHPNGSFESFDFPGAAPGTTEVSRMDDDGNIVGTYYDANQVQRGFVRYADCN